MRIRYLVTVAVFLFIAIGASADSKQQKFWTEYIETCNPAAQLNGKAHFLSSTNPIGPGSVWGTRGGTANLVGSQESYLGNADAKGHYPLVQYPSQPANCSAAGSRKWDFSLGLPVTILSAGNANLTAALNNVKSATVQISGVRVDSIGTAEWSDATDKVDRHSAVFQQAVDGRHYLMTAAAAITGMTITYKLDDAIAAKIKGYAQVGKTVTIGSKDEPVQAGLDISDNGKTATLILPNTAFAYVLAQFRPIHKLDPKQIFKTTTIATGKGPKIVPILKPNVDANVADPAKIKLSIQ